MKKLVLMIPLLFGVVGCCAYIDDAQRTAFQETKASTLLKRYEWFKDAANVLVKLQADVEIYNAQIKEAERDLDTATGGAERFAIREQVNQWRRERAGIKATYNSLASEYNSNMEKINYRFTNVDFVPASEQALPGKFATLISE
jgi:uncharacterized coiled-coil DUF342 family protein